MSIIDIGGQVREGEELNVLAVENWLKQQGIVLAGEAKLLNIQEALRIGPIVCNMTI